MQRQLTWCTLFEPKKKENNNCTLFLYLSDLLHSFLEDCTFVRFDIEVVNVVEVGEDQLGELFNVLVLVLAVPLLVDPLWTAGTKQRGKSSVSNSNSGRR